MTLREALTVAAAEFAADPHLHATATRDAELLLLHTLRIPRITLITHPHRDPTPPHPPANKKRLAPRLQHPPIQHIPGEQDFYAPPLKLTPAVLIPRPETEHLVEAVLKALPTNQPLKIADIG